MTDEPRAIAVRSRFWLSPFEAWIAAAAVYAGVTHWLLPASGTAVAVQTAVPRLVDVWSVLYAIGGLAVLLGLLRGSPRLEAAGLNLLGSGLTVSFIAFLSVGAPVLPTVIVQGGAVAAAAVRLVAMRRLR